MKKNFKRSNVVSLILATVMVVMSLMSGITALAIVPPVGSEIWSEDFSGTEYDSRIIPNGTSKVSQEELKITRAASGDTASYSGVNIYPNEDKTEVATGEFVTRFKIRRDSVDSTIHVRMRNSDGKDYSGFQWSKNGNSGTWYSDKKGADNETLRKFASNGVKTDVDSLTELWLTASFNLDNQTFSLWINNEQVVKNKYPKVATAADLKYIRIYTNTSGAELYVDDFSYYIEKTDAEKVQSDLEALSESIFADSLSENGLIKSDITLPKTGASGSSITWTSSNEALIKTNGEVSHADYTCETNPEVTLTATVKSGSVSESEVFTVKVIKENEYISGKPIVEEIIYANDFSSGELDEKYFTLNQSGGSVTVNNNALEINRTENTGTTIADIYFNEEHEGIEGRIGISYTLRKKKAGKLFARFRQSGGSDFTGIDWYKTHEAGFYMTDSEGVSGENKAEDLYEDELRVTALIDTTADTFDLWLNEEKVCEDASARSLPAENLRYLRFYLQTTTYITATVDDVKIYYAQETAVTNKTTTIEGEPAENIISGKTVDTSVTVKSSKSGSVCVFAALYSSADKMETVVFEKLDFDAPGEKTTDTLSIVVPENAQGYTLKTIVTDSLKPVAWLTENKTLDTVIQ